MCELTKGAIKALRMNLFAGISSLALLGRSFKVIGRARLVQGEWSLAN